MQSQRYLDKLGVQVMTNTLVSDYDGNNVLLSDGDSIPASTVIWAAGIKGNVPAGIDKNLIVRGNRIKTGRRCRIEGHSNIYAIGDLAYMETPNYPNGHPQVAPVAMQQAMMLAENLIRLERKSRAFYDFEYYDKGSMATVGRHLAVVDIPVPKWLGSSWHIGGLMAWLTWMGLHLLLLLGVKNRFFVFSNWLYNYITYDQNLRLIFKEFNKASVKHEKDKEVVEILGY
jgi:NADH dehydrogenase